MIIKIFKLSIVTSLVMSSSLSYAAMEIESYLGSREETPVGIPILSSPENGPIKKYNDDGSVNQFAWIDSSGQVQSDNLFFAPSHKLRGKTIKLCNIDNVNMECSNELTVVPNIRQRMTRSNVLNFEEYWDFSNQFTDDFILDSATTVNTKATFTYKGPVNASAGPKPVGILRALFNGNTALTTAQLEELTPSYATFEHERAFTTDLKTNNVELLGLCSSVVLTDATVGYFTPECDERLVRDSDIETNDTVYFYPPSPEQFSALFPSETMKKIESVTHNGKTKQYVYAPRARGNNNLLEAYCDAIGEAAKPMTESEMLAFASSQTFNQSWPGSTGYWTKDTAILNTWWSNAIPGGNGIVGILTALNANPTFTPAANSYYHGFFACKKG
ncbi:hypothetical protein [Vibrio sp. Hep-1b-8]|uniref:hypothetical protein n=1 Tax=Vibrio sp. Hep-1b-8 TaxID=2144187 RepID=UPI0011100A4B|nr:hypothetical protein [Vibrio sp. Hep-1b-8]TMX47432.1 hypothetical protein DA100_00520 [Vibrio sp. Hep-1b-8]